MISFPFLPVEGLHEFNLDWILKSIRKFYEKLEEFEDVTIPEEVKRRWDEETPAYIDSVIIPNATQAAQDVLADIQKIEGIQRRYIQIDNSNIDNYIPIRDDGKYYISDITDNYGNVLIEYLLTTPVLNRIADLPSLIPCAVARINLMIYAPSPVRNFWHYFIAMTDVNFSGVYNAGIGKIAWQGESSSIGFSKNLYTTCYDFNGSYFSNIYTHSVNSISVISPEGENNDPMFTDYIPEKAVGRINTLTTRNRRSISGYENGGILQINNDQSIWWGLYGVNLYDDFKYIGLHDEIYANAQGVNPLANEINFCNNTALIFTETTASFTYNPSRLATPRIIEITKDCNIVAKDGYLCNIGFWRNKNNGINRNNLLRVVTWQKSHNLKKGDLISVLMKRENDTQIRQDEYSNFIVSADNSKNDIQAAVNGINPVFTHLSNMKNCAIQYTAERCYFMYTPIRLSTDYIFEVEEDCSLFAPDDYQLIKITWKNKNGSVEDRNNLNKVTPWRQGVGLKKGEYVSISFKYKEDDKNIDPLEYSKIEVNNININDVTIPLNLFENIGICGDSYTIGTIYKNENEYNRYTNHTWGKVLERRYNISVELFGTGGLTTRTFKTNTNALPKLLNAEPKEFYILNLGINDAGLGSTYIGSVNDIKNNEDNNNDTFYGNYGYIIAKIKKHAPKCKIMILGNLYGTGTLTEPLKEASKNIAEKMNVSFIDPLYDGYFSSALWESSILNAHPRAYSYAGAATAIERLFGKCVNDYIDYYADYLNE